MTTQDELFGMLNGAKWHGKYFRAYCPFHDDDQPGSMPSLLVYPERAKCLGWCDKWYSLEQVERKVGKDAIGRPVAANGLYPDWGYLTEPELASLVEASHENLNDTFSMTTGRDEAGPGLYLKNRKIYGGDVDLYKIGWDKNNPIWITIPVYSEDDALMGIVGRAWPDHTKSNQVDRYYLCGKPLPFCPDWGRLRKCEVILVPYGIFDAWHILDVLKALDPQQKFGVITSTHGKKFNPDWLVTYRKRIIPVPDYGEMGAALKLQMQLGWRGCKPIQLPYTSQLQDPADFVEKGKANILWKFIAKEMTA